MCVYFYTGVISKAVVASTQTPQRDTLTLVYNADLNTAPTSLVSSIPQPSFSSSTLSCVNAPVYVKRLPTVASTKVTRGEITGSVRNQQKPLQFTKQSKPEVVMEGMYSSKTRGWFTILHTATHMQHRPMQEQMTLRISPPPPH